MANVVYTCQVEGSKDQLAAGMEQVEHAAQLEAEQNLQQQIINDTDCGPASLPGDVSATKTGTICLSQRASQSSNWLTNPRSSSRNSCTSMSLFKSPCLLLEAPCFCVNWCQLPIYARTRAIPRHHMSAAHAYLAMFSSVCRMGQADIRTIS